MQLHIAVYIRRINERSKQTKKNPTDSNIYPNQAGNFTHWSHIMISTPFDGIGIECVVFMPRIEKCGKRCLFNFEI